MTYYDKRFPQPRKATLKTLLMTTMTSGSNAVGEPIVPHFQFQTLVKSDKAKAIQIKCMRYMIDVRATFGHEDEQFFLVSFGLNHKGGMDNDNFFSVCTI